MRDGGGIARVEAVLCSCHLSSIVHEVEVCGSAWLGIFSMIESILPVNDRSHRGNSVKGATWRSNINSSHCVTVPIYRATLSDFERICCNEQNTVGYLYKRRFNRPCPREQRTTPAPCAAETVKKS